MFSISSSIRPRLRKSIAVASVTSLAAVGMSLGAGAGSATAAGFTTAACSGSAIGGGGASFPNAAHNSAYIPFGWPDHCGSSAPAVTYTSTGSGCGMQLMGRHNKSCASSDATIPNNDAAPYSNSRSYSVRFGQSDDPLSTSNISEINAGSDSTGDEGKILQIPNALGAIAVIVHTPEGCTIFKKPGTSSLMSTGSGDTGFSATEQAQISNFGSSNGDIARLQLTRAQLVGIWNRSSGYRTWGDIVPWINDGNGTAGDASDTRCVNWPIIRIKRADDSGSTYAFKDLLNSLDPSTGWKVAYGSGNQKWPAAADLVSWDYNNDGTTSGTASTTVNGDVSGSTTVQVNSATGIVVGMTVAGTGITGSPTVSAVSGTTLTLSSAQTIADTTALTFTKSQTVANCAQQGTAGTDFGADRSTWATNATTGIGCSEANVPTLQTSDAATPAGGGNLVEKVYNTPGSIGYASLADARAKKTQAFERQPSTVSGLTGNDYMYWVKLQTRKAGGTTFADPSIGNGYQTAGARGANCSAAVVSGLGDSAPLYGLDGATTGVSAVDSSDTGYPDCTLSFGLVWQDYAAPYALNIAAAADPAAAKAAEEKKARTVVDYFNSILNEGQGYVQGYDYSPLPASIKAKAQSVLNTVTFDGYADTVAPNAPSLSGAPSGSTTLRSATITVTPAEAGGTVEYKVDSGSWTTGTSVSLTGLALGSHTVQARQTDAASNVGAVASATWTVAAVNAPSISGAPASSTRTTTANVSLSSDAGTTLKCSVDGAAYQACTSPLALSGLAVGLHSIAVKAVDSDGNESGAAVASWTVTKTAAPSVTPSWSGSNVVINTGFVTATGEAGATLTCSIDGTAYTACTALKGVNTLGLGNHTIAFKATDAGGSVSDATMVAFTVVPNNVIKVGTVSAITSARKTISVPVTLIPGAGSLSVIVTAPIGGVDTQIGSLVVSRSAKGPYTAKINPNSAGLAAIRAATKNHGPGLNATLTIGFTPTGGTQYTLTKTLTLK